MTFESRLPRPPDAANGLLALLLLVALSAVMTYPLSVEPGGRALDLGPDTRLFLWTLGWNVHALLHQPLSLFDANIFFPAPSSLAYSEHQLASALLAAPSLLASGNPVLALNFVVLFSCAASAAGAFFLARSLGMGRAGALAAGIVFAFAPPRFFRLGQPHLATVQWIPFCLGFLHRYAAGGSLKHLLGAAAFFTLQALSGGQAALFLALAAAALLAYLHGLGRLRPRGRFWRDALLAGALLLAANAPFLVPYLRAQAELGLERSLVEAEEWSPRAASFLVAPTHVQSRLVRAALGDDFAARANAYLFPGFVALILAAVGVRRGAPGAEPAESLPSAESGLRPLHAVFDSVLALCCVAALAIQASGGFRLEIAGLSLSARTASRPLFAAGAVLLARLLVLGCAPFAFGSSVRRGLAALPGFYVLLAIVSFWAALGPSWGLYAALYRLLPGFDFVRVPSRLTLLTILAIAVLAGRGVERLAPGEGRARVGVAAAALALMIFEYAAFPLAAGPYAVSIPAVDRALAAEPGRFAVVELPVPDPRDRIPSARLHSLYMIHSMAHWQKLVNGYSGFTPPGHDALFRKLVRFPDEESLAALERIGVRFAVVHRDYYPEDRRRELDERLAAFSSRLERRGDYGEGVLLRLTRSGREP